MFALNKSNRADVEYYAVKKLAKLAGVSVRTLHLYDQIGLLKPSSRTGAGYRMYGQEELLRLQQILFYKELDFSLQQIGDILDDPAFDLVRALEDHKSALRSKRERISTLLTTIDKTISNLKGEFQMTPEELYEGLPKEKAEAYRAEAMEKYGADAVLRSENELRKMSKEDFKKLGEESAEIRSALLALVNEDPASEKVQAQIARHYESIRKYWGTSGSADKQAQAYKGLGQLYVDDERFTMIDGKPQPEFALFLSKAMAHFSDTKLK
jgi:DNA-binding transcriptional MerR regulator